MARFELTEENVDEAIKNNKTILIDFWAEWCAPCKTFAPVFEQASEKYPDIAFASCNTEAQQRVAGMFGIRAIPTLVVIKEQILIFQRAGALPEAALEDVLQQTIKLDMDKVRKRIAEEKAKEQTRP
jgi:thioredoxin 1